MQGWGGWPVRVPQGEQILRLFPFSREESFDILPGEVDGVWCPAPRTPRPLFSTLSTTPQFLMRITFVCLERGMWDAQWSGCIQWVPCLCFPSRSHLLPSWNPCCQGLSWGLVQPVALVSAASCVDGTEFAAPSITTLLCTFLQGR